MKQTIQILALVFLAGPGVRAQGVTNSGVLFVGNGARVTVYGGYTHFVGNPAEPEGLQIDNLGELYLSGDFSNESTGSVANGYTGTIIFNGTGLQTIKSTSFEAPLLHSIKVQNAAGLALDGAVHFAGVIDLLSGDINLNTSDLHLIHLDAQGPIAATSGIVSGEPTHRIFTSSTGKIVTDARSYNDPDLENYVNVAGLGAHIRIDNIFDAELSVQRAHVQQNANGNNESVLRSYHVTVSGLVVPPGDLKLYYLDQELGTLATQEANLSLFRSSDGGTSWVNRGGTVNAAGNFVELPGIADLNGLWTLSYCIPPLVSLGSDIAACPGDATTLTATATGTGPFTYKWFKGATEVVGQTSATLGIVVTAEEEYSVHVTDSRGCSASDVVEVSPRTLPQVDLGNDVSVCPGQTVLLDAGPGFSSYQWTDVEEDVLGNNQTLLVDFAGLVAVEISDVFGCRNSDAILITHKPLPQSNLPPSISTCGEEVVLGVGLEALNPDATFVWRNQAGATVGTQPTYTATLAGAYSVTITGSNGCQLLSTTAVIVNSSDFANLGPDRLVCVGAAVTFDATRPSSTYLWSTGETTPTITITAGSSPVTISVEITDLINSCVSTDEVEIVSEPLPVVSLGQDFDVCEGFSTILDAGSGFASYLWSDNSTNQTLAVSAVGVYSVEVTSALGCKNSDEVVLGFFDPIVFNFSPETATCGTEVVLGFGLDELNPGATYLWNNGETTPTIEVDQEGDFTVTITDVNGCSATGGTEALLNATDFVNLGPDKQVCAQSTVTLSALRPNSTYLWSTGATTPAITITVGSVSVEVWVEVNDLLNACTASDTIEVASVPLPVVNLGPDFNICEGTSATLNAGNGFATYLWGNNSTSQTRVVLGAGVYTVTVTNSFGCKNTDSITIGLFPPIQLTLPTHTSVCGTQVELGVGLAAGNPGATFSWSNGATTPTITVSQSGPYTVTVTDANNCSKSASTNAVLHPTDFVNLGPDITIECESVTLDAGNPGSTYAWSDASTSRTLLVDTPGTYSVTVTNVFGCIDSDEIAVVLQPPLDSAFFLAATEAMVNDTIYFIGLTTAATSNIKWDFDDGAVLDGAGLNASHHYIAAGEFYPSLTTSFTNGCEDSYDKLVTITEITPETPSGGRVRGRLIEDVMIYPNPNDGIFTVTVVLSDVASMRASLISATGVFITRIEEQSGRANYELSYNISGVPPGIYFLTIAVENEIRRFRVLVER